MAKVFIVNEPLKKDDATGEYVRFLPMETAHDFGDVHELTPKGNPGSNLRSCMRSIREGLAQWKDGDYIVLVGDQALLAYASAVVGERIAETLVQTDGEVAPTLRFLKWERRQGTYVPLTFREARESVS